MQAVPLERCKQEASLNTVKNKSVALASEHPMRALQTTAFPPPREAMGNLFKGRKVS